jgi:DNA-binding NarL/FixJ family response regulator
VEILLVDDHALFREGLCLVLKQLEDSIIFEAESAADALRAAGEQPELDLILLDLNLPDNDDFSLLQSLRKKRPATPVAMLSATEDPLLIQQALQLGASGFIPKSSNSKIMIQAIQLILAGGLYLPPQILQQNQNLNKPEPTGTTSNISELYFTDRQIDVLRLLDQGLSNKEIAKKLVMSPSTVKVHVAAILRECNASNRTLAVSLARQQGVLN